MRKNYCLLIATFAMIIFLHSCKTDVDVGGGMYSSMKSVDFATAGMHYKIFVSAAGPIFVVNVTNDSLQHLQLLKLQP